MIKYLLKNFITFIFIVVLFVTRTYAGIVDTTDTNADVFFMKQNPEHMVEPNCMIAWMKVFNALRGGQAYNAVVLKNNYEAILRINNTFIATTPGEGREFLTTLYYMPDNGQHIDCYKMNDNARKLFAEDGYYWIFAFPMVEPYPQYMNTMDTVDYNTHMDEMIDIYQGANISQERDVNRNYQIGQPKYYTDNQQQPTKSQYIVSPNVNKINRPGS